MRARPHERFGAKVKLDPSTVSTFAAAVGDTNPLHHDADYAAQTRYGRRTAAARRRPRT